MYLLGLTTGAAMRTDEVGRCATTRNPLAQHNLIASPHKKPNNISI